MSGLRTERYVLRPFEGVQPLDDVLAGVRLAIAGDLHEPSSVVLASDRLLAAPLMVTLPAPSRLQAAFDGGALSPSDCALVILASARTHRRSSVLSMYEVEGGSWGTDHALVRDKVPLVLSDANGFTVTVAVVLTRELAPRPLQPYLPGTWLARRDFVLLPERDETSFTPEQLTEQVRKDFGLPAKAPTFVHVDGDLLLDAESVADAVHVYVEPDLLRLLQQGQQDIIGEKLQADLAIQALCATARTSVHAVRTERGREISESDLKDHPAIDHFFNRLSGQLKRSVQEVLDMSDSGEVLAAHLSAAFDLQRLTLRILRGAPTADVLQSGGES